ncbi:MAG: sigma-54 dependent transcriptional regulator [Candidatus Saccharicenans sp.]|nr:sigma-54 dependent transcriptional regulator [Candidatus Saccharicenans sp.]
MELRNSIERRLLGRSQAIREIREQIRKIAPFDMPALITSETGVGKSLVAELIHKLSPRASKEFIHLNCSNLSSELFESELFGHEKGAFTGTVERKRGKLEVADGGTVFLDEVGDLHLSNQAKLLSFMDKGTFYRLGGTEKLRADVRIIAATNKNLAEEIRYGRFRQDLFFRISVINIHIHPLRKRKEDIPLLAEEILSRECEKNCIDKSLSSEALSKLVAYHWPGNVRELENVLKNAVVFCDGHKITAEAIAFDEVPWPESSENPYSGDILVLQKYREMVEGKRSFWEVVHKPFLKRELNREQAIKIVQMGLKEAGTYRKVMELFNAGCTQKDYKRFMKVLSRLKLNPRFRGIKSP